jgi:hypothetical protein
MADYERRLERLEQLVCGQGRTLTCGLGVLAPDCDRRRNCGCWRLDLADLAIDRVGHGRRAAAVVLVGRPLDIISMFS